MALQLKDFLLIASETKGVPIKKERKQKQRQTCVLKINVYL